MRIKWIQSTSRAGGAYAKLREMVCTGVEFAEEKIGAALAVCESLSLDYITPEPFFLVGLV